MWWKNGWWATTRWGLVGVFRLRGAKFKDTFGTFWVCDGEPIEKRKPIFLEFQLIGKITGLLNGNWDLGDDRGNHKEYLHRQRNQLSNQRQGNNALLTRISHHRATKKNIHLKLKYYVMIKKFLFISTLLLSASLTHPNSVICFAMKCTSLLRDTGTCRLSTSISSAVCSPRAGRGRCGLDRRQMRSSSV